MEMMAKQNKKAIKKFFCFFLIANIDKTVSPNGLDAE